MDEENLTTTVEASNNTASSMVSNLISNLASQPAGANNEIISKAHLLSKIVLATEAKDTVITIKATMEPAAAAPEALTTTTTRIARRRSAGAMKMKTPASMKIATTLGRETAAMTGMLTHQSVGSAVSSKASNKIAARARKAPGIVPHKGARRPAGHHIDLRTDNPFF